MYNQYFGFKENPFSISPDPRFLYMSEMHQDALAHLNYGISADGCIILLTGEVGTGKTTICRCFLEQMEDHIDVAVILNPKLKALELLAAICDEFQIPVHETNTTVKHYIDALNRFLLKTHAQNRRSLLIIDEAQNLDKDVLEMVRLLTNLETSKQKLLKIFLLGQSELSTILAQPDMTQINQRITGRFHLRGLQPADVDIYIKHRITIAGGGKARQLFETRAIRSIHRLSNGIPRLINNLCDRSLLGAYAEEKTLVTTSIVKKAAAEISSPPVTQKSSRNRLKLVVVATLAVILMITLWFGTAVDHFNFDIGSLLSGNDPEQVVIKTESLDQESQEKMIEEQSPDPSVETQHSREPSSLSKPEPEQPVLSEPPDITETAAAVDDQLPEDEPPVERHLSQTQEQSQPEPAESMDLEQNETDDTKNRIIIKQMEIAQ